MQNLRGGLTVLPSQAANWQNGRDAAGDSGAAATDRALAVRLRVLLVEDDPGDAELVQYALRQSRQPSFVVTYTESLKGALETLRQVHAFDVILLDLSLPDSSGLSTISCVHDVTPNIPIVIMTGLDDPLIADQALEAGAQDYLVKSDDPERTVVRAIRYAITRMNSQIERNALAAKLALQQKLLLAELATARDMQFGLLPRPDTFDARFKEYGLHVEAAFEPSSGIGGDLWGCLETGNGRVAFYAFDFSGHGIGAALNVFRLHTLITEHWDPRQEPADLLKVLASALKGLLPLGHYATMVFAILDTNSDILEWSSAGAPSPILIQDGKALYLDSRGVPLGLSKSATYTNRSMPFPKGSSLFMYSDAITEAICPGGEVFGEERLISTIEDAFTSERPFSIEEILNPILSAVELPLQDDLTAVLISRIKA